MIYVIPNTAFKTSFKNSCNIAFLQYAIEKARH